MDSNERDAKDLEPIARGIVDEIGALHFNVLDGRNARGEAGQKGENRTG